MAAKSSSSGGGVKGSGIKYTPKRLSRPSPARRGTYAQAAPGGDFGAGWKIGQSIGGGLGELANAIVKARQQAAQDRIANRVLNTAYAPRAAFVGGVQPKVGVPLAGTTPETGGSAALSEAIRGQQLLASLQQQKTAAETIELRRQAAAAGAGGRGGGPWGGGGGSASRYMGQGGQGPWNQPRKGKYQPGSSSPDQPDYYDYGHMRADIDNQYGRGTYDRLVGAQGKIETDPATGKPKPGVYEGVTVKDDGSLVFDKGPTIPVDHLPGLMARYDATSVKQGFKPVYTNQYLGTQNPQSGSAGGSVTNPYVPKSQVELNAVPPDGYFVNPKDGKVYQNSAEQAQQPSGGAPPGHRELTPPAAPAAPAPAPAAVAAPVPAPAPTPAPDYSTQVTPQPIDLASAMPNNVPPSFSLGQLPTGGLGQDSDLAAAIAQARGAQALQGLA